MHKPFSNFTTTGMGGCRADDRFETEEQLFAETFCDLDCVFPSFASFSRIADMLSEELLDDMNRAK